MMKLHRTLQAAVQTAEKCAQTWCCPLIGFHNILGLWLVFVLTSCSLNYVLITQVLHMYYTLYRYIVIYTHFTIYTEYILYYSNI